MCNNLIIKKCVIDGVAFIKLSRLVVSIHKIHGGDSMFPSFDDTDIIILDD
jgi:hypothetical protein